MTACVQVARIAVATDIRAAGPTEGCRRSARSRAPSRGSPDEVRRYGHRKGHSACDDDVPVEEIPGDGRAQEGGRIARNIPSASTEMMTGLE